ncbi:MAG: hypothetical protein LBC46_03405, partial [Treponema sp.]|nr:hypothetical protein [Treponema sp.]
DDAGELVLAVAGIGFGAGAIVGFLVPFILDFKKEERVRAASFPAIKVNVAPTSSRNLGVQLSCRWWIK